MVFKRLLGSLGVGGPSVDTVLDPGPAVPGGSLGGHVHLTGGGADFDIERITLELVARVEAEHEDGESEGALVFDRFTVGGGFRLAEGEQRSIPFSVMLPWETPVTELRGQPLGVVLGVRTELEVAGARDKGDLDPLAVRPLAVQEAILEALGQLGFGFRTADLELGHIGGTGQQLPFFQEIELAPPAQYAHTVNEIEVTFLAHPGGMEVVLEADKRGGLFSMRPRCAHPLHRQPPRGRAARLERRGRRLDPPTRRGPVLLRGAQSVRPWRAVRRLRAQGRSQSRLTPPRRGHGRSGPGMGTAVAAGAAGLAVGVVGGMVAAEVVDEVGDFFEGDDEEGED